MKFNFYPNLKHWEKFNAIWIYSDPHFSEPDMIKLRNISDEEQLRRINSKVGKNDLIIFLGDIGNIERIKKVKGYKVLVMGNHDQGKSNYQRRLEMPKHEPGSMFPQASCIDNHLFDEVYPGILPINDKILLSHEPVFLPFMFNIHGHDHNNGNAGSMDFNCCAEHINFTPVSLNYISKSGMLSKVKSIHRLTTDNAIERKAKREEKKHE